MNIQFNPIQCTSQTFKDLSPNEGFLYFVTDTKQIFLGKDNQFIDMCGGINIVYGKKYIEYVDSGQSPDPNVSFSLSELEVAEYPLENDLILNEDGCFYRVKAISKEEDRIETTRLTLQGSGGSNSSGGGAGSANIRINHYGGQNRYFSAQSKKAELGIIAYSDDAENYISGVELAWNDSFDQPFLTKSNLTHPMEKPYYIDIVKYLSNISTKGTKVYIRVTDKYGTTRYTYYVVSIASLQLAPIEKELFDIYNDNFDYRCTVGGSLDLESRIIKYELYSDTSATPIYDTEYELSSTQVGQISKKLDFSSVNHGAYTLKVQMTGVVNGVNIYSNELIHRVLLYKESVGTAIFSALIPEVIEQYTPFEIFYLLSYGNATKEYAVKIFIDNELVSNQSIYAKEVNSYAFSFETQGNYLLKLSIDELGATFEAVLEVRKYSGELPVININRDDLKLYLSAKGRTNNTLDKDKWPDIKNNEIVGQLNNFYYRSVNGWMKDEEGVDYLKVTQNATVDLSDYTPFDEDPKEKGLTIELDFMIDGIFDYDCNFIECLSLYGDETIKTGFVVKGDTFKYYASGSELVSLNLVEGKRIKLAFVIEPKDMKDINGKTIPYPMCYTFLDGIISNVFHYLEDDDFRNNQQYPARLKINSNGGQINIYNIRIYNTALDEQNILNNYQATIGSLTERQKNYEENLIRDVYGVIDLEAIEAENYNLQIPYVKIYGGYGADKNFKMSNKAPTNNPTLPIGKKDYRLIDIEIHYPKPHQNPYFADYKDFAMTTTFNDSAFNVINGFGQTPDTGAIMYAQGTSSLEYPVKNLRVKLKGDKFTVRPDITPVELVTFKADFMESAGAHNTGAANYVDFAYESVGIATPGQVHYINRDDAGTIVTCIKGHPCVIFWNPGIDDKGNVLDKSAKNYHYIGKYNFNLDKATPEPFGFSPDKQDEKFSYLIDENGDLVLNEKGEKQNSVFCFEFLDNNEKVCNFLSDPTSQALVHEDGTPYTEQEKYYDSWYGSRVNEDKEVVPGWCIGFESRHPEDKTGLHDADALWPLASWINNLYAIRYIDGDEATALRRFKDEYQRYLDKDFLLAYYLITEVLLMADNRVKNMMIATWGPEHREWVDSAGKTQSHFGYIWYPIFYDMDTMLGLDNIGYVNKNYYDEDTVEDVYNGDEILWKFVRDALKDELILEYDRYEQALGNPFTAPVIIPYFNDNQATMANETFYNEDAFYKYIDTFRNGYTNHLTGEAVLPGKSTRLYAAQGNRAMMREFFIENRIRYLCGKYESYNYQNGDRIEFRLTYPKKVEAVDGYVLTEEDRKINASIQAVPPVGTFNYKSLKTGYAGVKVGTSSDNYRFVGEEEHTLTVDTSSGNGTETYLFGVSNLADIGDLSNKYLYMLIVGAAQNNLKKLILGNHHKDYYNPYWGTDSIELTGFRFLEEFNLENCATFGGGIDFSDCPQIKKILLNGSNPRAITLPIGGVIEELRIPDSLTTFNIDSHPTLMDDKLTIGYFDYTANEYKNNYKNLANISLKGLPNVDTYKIARGALFNSPLKLETYCFNDVHWILNKEDDFEYDDNGKIISIRALDILHNSLAPFTGVKTEAEALTGTLVIALTGKTVNEFDIYQKYHFIYPNLNIIYGENVSVELASSINFYNLETINESSEPYYTVLSNKEKTLQFLTSAQGPVGIALQSPVKVSTATESFTFANSWLDQNGKRYLDSLAPYERKNISDISEIKLTDSPSDENKFYLYTLTKEDESVEEYMLDKENNIIRVYSFELTIPTEDRLQLTPIFIASDRLYTVQFYSDARQSLGTYYYNHNEYLFKNDLVPIYYTKDDSGLEDPDSERYIFMGWITEKDFENNEENPVYIDEESFKVTRDMKLYARCAVDKISNPTDSKYFDFELIESPNISYSTGYFDINEAQNGFLKDNANIYSDVINYNCGESFYKISIKEKYRNHLGGKITIPSYKSKTDSTPVKLIGDISRTSKITHIFFLEDSECVGSVSGEYGVGFYMSKKLKAAYLPDSFKFIGANCFRESSELEVISANNLEYIGDRAFQGCAKLKITSLPDSISYIGARAFFLCTNLALTKLPNDLTQVRDYTFSGCQSLKIQYFGCMPEQIEQFALSNNLIIIGPRAFEGAGHQDITEITLGSSLKALGNHAFGGYGNDTVLFTVNDETVLNESTGIGILDPTNISNDTQTTISSLVFGNKDVDVK